MSEDLNKFLKGFYRSLIRISNGGELDFDNFINSIENGDISLITVNTVIKSNEDDFILSSIEEHLDQLWEINRRPRKYLQTEEVIRPVELSKNINTRTIYELSKNSSHWRRIKIDGVEPSKLLTELNEDDYEIYENRIYKTLLDKISYILDNLQLKNENLRENVKNANTISNNLTKNHKSARIFEKLAPRALESLNKINILEIDQKINTIKDLFRKVTFLRSQGLYQMLLGTRDVLSPLNKTNILMQERNYKGMVELWNDIEQYSIDTSDGSSQDGIIDEVTDFHYLLYVYFFGIIVLKEMGYVNENSKIGNVFSCKLVYRGGTDLDKITYALKDNEIRIDIVELKKYEIQIPSYLNDFFSNAITPSNVQISPEAIIFENLTDNEFLDNLREQYKEYVKNASRVSEKMKRFNREILDLMKQKLRKKYDKKSLFIKTSLGDFVPSNAALWNYSNELLDQLLKNLINRPYSSHYYIIPKIELTKEYDLKESIYHRFNNIGEDYRCDYDSTYITALSNYRAGIFMVSYDNLVSLTRFTKMLNAHRYGLGSVKETLKYECPVCGSARIKKSGDSDYSCHKCGSMWSESKCNLCKNTILWVREKNEDPEKRNDDEKINEYYDRLDLERGSMAVTSGVFEDLEFKTICSNCGKVLGLK